MFINLSNHPCTTWDEDQLMAATSYGEIVDIPFPDIPPTDSSEEVALLAEYYFIKIKKLLSATTDDSVIHLMGETVFVFALATKLINAGYTVIASCTERIVHYEGKDKISTFKFISFRKFIAPQ